jgi:hypothetical protein
MDEVFNECLSGGASIAPIDGFLSASRYMEGDAGQRIRSSLRGGLSEGAVQSGGAP